MSVCINTKLTYSTISRRNNWVLFRQFVLFWVKSHTCIGNEFQVDFVDLLRACCVGTIPRILLKQQTKRIRRTSAYHLFWNSINLGIGPNQSDIIFVKVVRLVSELMIYSQFVANVDVDFQRSPKSEKYTIFIFWNCNFNNNYLVAAYL